MRSGFREGKRGGWSNRNTTYPMKKTFTIVFGLLSVFIGAGLILPALAKVRDYGAMPREVVGLYTLGIVLALAGISTAAFGLIKCRAAESR
jgi:vacuolar-type H+-ATPase subunit I/STV1